MALLRISGALAALIGSLPIIGIHPELGQVDMSRFPDGGVTNSQLQYENDVKKVSRVIMIIYKTQVWIRDKWRDQYENIYCGLSN